MNKAPEIPCPACEGKGHIELNGALGDTFLVVKSLRIASPEIVKKKIRDRVTVSAVSNRLRELFEMGLLDRSKTGSTYFYSVCLKKRNHQSKKN